MKNAAYSQHSCENVRQAFITRSRMKIKLIYALFILLGMQFFLEQKPASSQSEKVCLADVKPAIEAIINRSQFQRSRWGILIQTLDKSQTIYSLAAQGYFTPASSLKILTTAAVLSHLGSEYRIRTSVYGEPDNPNLTQLRVVGRGDPSFTNKQLQDLAQQLKLQGIEKIEKLIVEDGYFSESAINPTWQWEDLIFYYATAVNSLILNENTVNLTLLPQKIGQPVRLLWDDAIAARQWRVENFAQTAPAQTPYDVEVTGVLGKPLIQIRGNLAVDAKPDPWDLAIIDPGNYFLESFRQTLTQQGITVKQGTVSVGNTPQAGEEELAMVESLPIKELLIEANQNSNNIYAESLLYTLGANSPSRVSAVETAKQILTKLGVEPDSYFLYDGSGLSRQNLVSPQAIAQTLQLMAQTPQAEVYRNSLSLAGVNGTLRRRFQDTPVQGNLWGKTGTLTGATALVGYLNVPEYQTLVFSIMVNQSQQRASIHRQAMDEIILMLMKLNPC